LISGPQKWGLALQGARADPGAKIKSDSSNNNI